MQYREGQHVVVIQNYLVLGLLNVAALLMLTLMVVQNGGIGPGRRGIYLTAIAATIVAVVSELYCVLFEGGLASARWLYVVSTVAGFSVTPVIPVLLASVFGGTGARVTWLNLIPCAANALLAILSPFFGFLFEISPDDAYRRGALFGAFIAACLWAVLVILRTVVQTGRRYQYHFRFKLAALFTFIVLGTSVQVALPDIHATWTAITLAMTLYYGFVCEFNDTLDALTKLYNRKSYENEIERLRKKDRFSVIVMDVDDFKKINDRYGHPYGDRCLKKLAELVQRSFYRIGTCYRIGGDEFCVLSGVVDEKKITAALRELTQEIEKLRAEDPMVPVLSCGWQVCSGNSENCLDMAVRAADRQMYANKARRKGERSD
jgi:diguanylate cyclase (GGDEF)-like protein